MARIVTVLTTGAVCLRKEICGWIHLQGLPIDVLSTSMRNVALWSPTTIIMAILTLGTKWARHLCAFRKTEVTFDFGLRGKTRGNWWISLWLTWQNQGRLTASILPLKPNSFFWCISSWAFSTRSGNGERLTFQARASRHSRHDPEWRVRTLKPRC